MSDIGQKLCFPAEFALTNLKLDLVLWLTSLKHVYIIELKVLWESVMEEAYERKKLRYAELAVDVE